MNRRDSNPASRQSGGYRDESSDWESPRQASQWQDDAPRQAGGWGNEEGRAHRDDAARRNSRRDENDARWRTDEHGDSRYRERGGYGSQARGQSYGEGPYGGDRRPASSERGYRFSGEREVYPIREYDASGGNDFADFTSEDFGGRDFYARRGGGGGLSPSFSYRPTFDTFGRGYYGSRSSRTDNEQGRRDYGDWREYGEERGFFQRAGDEIASWFGDEDAARRREQDHRGRGPSDYTRSDERIREDLNDRLTQDWRVDATNIRVLAKDGEVTLDGKVGSRHAKRRAEDLAEEISGVKHVQNNLRVIGATDWTDTGQGGSTSSARSSTTTGSATGTSASTNPTSGSTTGSSS
jgi:hypothetical protein